jgi:hypothetical protein
VVDGKEHWEGEWELLLALQLRGDLKSTATVHHAVGPAFGQAAALPFHALVHARSNLHLRASLSQSALTPGSEIHVRAVITEYGQPIETHPHVIATLTRPDRTIGQLSFSESALGEFETSILASQAGVYRFHIQASGLSSRGLAFTREHLLSAVVGHPPRDPVGPPPGGGRETLCEFLKCLHAKGVIDERLIRRLESLGIDVRQLWRCLAASCDSPAAADPDQPIK